MKTNKIKKRLAALLLVAFCATSVMPVSAGLKTVVRDSSTAQGEMDESVWHNANGDVLAENGVIVFPKESIADTKLVAKVKVKANEGVAEMASMAATLQFTNLPQGEKFVVGLGLGSIESELGESGNVEVSFFNEGGLKVAITAYTEEGEATELMAAKKCGSLSKTDMKLLLKADQTLSVQIGGTQIYNAKLPVSGEGRIGFLQTGSCGVRVSNIQLISYDYERPENCDIFEDFEDGEFNKNLLTSKLIHASNNQFESFVGIGEYNENQVFKMTYPSLCYLGTRYQYSNFEMSFDVPYIQRSNELDDEGNVIKRATSQLIVTFGGEGATYSDYGYETATERLLFRNISAITTKSGKTQSLQSTFPFFDSEYKDKGFSIKIRMVDNQVTIFMKWIEETQWMEVMSYALPTPTGYIHIWGEGRCDYAIDNLKIVNLDVNPALVEVEYASSIIEVPEDYAYEPMEKEYKELNIKEEAKEAFSLYLCIPIVAGVCVLALGTTAVLMHCKKRKERGGAQDEK